MGDSEHLIEMMADILEQQGENGNTLPQRQANAFSIKVIDELMEIQRRDDIPVFHKEKMRDMMNMMMSNSSSDGVQSSCNYKKMRELMEKQFSSSNMPFYDDNMVQIMYHELYEVVCDKNAGADGFVRTLERICAENKVELATIFNDVTPTGDSLLHVAAEHGNEQVLCLIAFHYPKLLYKTNFRGDTPLHVASKTKNLLSVINILDMEKHFITSDGDKEEFIMLRNKYGGTALHEAVLSKDYNVVLFLLVAHKQSDLTNYWTWNSSYGCKSPMYLAVLTRDVDILSLMLITVSIPSGKAISNGDSPLHAAILEPDEVLLKVIVDTRQELLYQRDENKNTPLHYAAYNGVRGVIHILVEKSPKMAFQRNSDGNLPIHLACQEGWVGVVKKLLDIEWPNAGLFLNDKGQNILHIAARMGHNDLIRYLMKHPKIHEDTVNERDANGDTPLHLATRELRLWNMYFLSRHENMDVNIVNNEGFTAADVFFLQARVPWTRQERLAFGILYKAGVTLKANWMGIQSKRTTNKEWNVKDAANSLIVVAILIATVSFTAGFAVPGGFYSSDHSLTKESGMALLSNQTLFKIFMVFNTVSMYSSTIGCFILLWVPTGDSLLATRAHHHAIFVVHVALLTMSIAFQCAIRLIVSNNTLLANVINVIGFIGILIMMFFNIMAMFLFLEKRLRLLRRTKDLALKIMLLLVYGPSDFRRSDLLSVNQDDATSQIK